MSCKVFVSLLLLLSGVVVSSSSHHDLAHDHVADEYLTDDNDQLPQDYLSSDQLFGHRQLAPEGLPDNLNLGTVTLQAVDQFLANKPAVLSLVHCFMDESKCQTKGESNFATQIKRLGRGGQCFRCTPQEQANIKNIMRRTIAAMQKLYPAEWNSLVPILRNLF